MTEPSFQSLTRPPNGGASSLSVADMVIKGDRIAFSRWGDGEWDCLFYRGLANCDRSQYFFDMAQRLEKVIANPVTNRPSEGYYFGMQQKAWGMSKFEIMQYLVDKQANKQWVDADEFHDMSERGEFLDWLKKIDFAIGLVAPARLDPPIRVERRFDIELKNAWLYYDPKKLKRAFESFDGVILFCAGVAANVMIDDLYFSPIGERCSLLDMGSVLDPYSGFKTRKYHWRVNA